MKLVFDLFLFALAVPLRLRSTNLHRPRTANSSPTTTVARRAPASTNRLSTPTPPDSDVIVVGAGISGVVGDAGPGRGGARVTLIDMSSVFGGHAVMSQGSLSIAGSPVQEAAGIHDSPDLAYQDFLKFGEDCDAEWVRYYVDHSRTEIYDWVDRTRRPFRGGPASPGNSVDREHQPVGRGIGLVTPIYRACQEQPGVHFVWNTKVEQLLIEDGRVTGVLAGTCGRTRNRNFTPRTSSWRPADFRAISTWSASSGRRSSAFRNGFCSAPAGIRWATATSWPKPPAASW